MISLGIQSLFFPHLYTPNLPFCVRLFSHIFSIYEVAAQQKLGQSKALVRLWEVFGKDEVFSQPPDQVYDKPTAMESKRARVRVMLKDKTATVNNWTAPWLPFTCHTFVSSYHYMTFSALGWGGGEGCMSYHASCWDILLIFHLLQFLHGIFSPDYYLSNVVPNISN